MKEKVFVSLEIPAELDLQARVEAAKRRMSRSKLIREAVKTYLSALEQNQEQPGSRVPTLT